LLDGPLLPREAVHIWTWFLELCGARSSNGWGPNPLGFQDIRAWAELTGTTIRPVEVQVLLRLDQEWLSEGNKAAEQRQAWQKAKQQNAARR
jgi:hypothetical protein